MLIISDYECSAADGQLYHPQPCPTLGEYTEGGGRKHIIARGWEESCEILTFGCDIHVAHLNSLQLWLHALIRSAEIQVSQESHQGSMAILTLK